MNTELDPARIVQLLTQGTRQLDAQTLTALSRARQHALERQVTEAPVFALSAGGRWSHGPLAHSASRWIAALVLVAAMVSVVSYRYHAQEQQIGELDVAILTDELPMEVFLD